jgi:hypothetical protein
MTALPVARIVSRLSGPELPCPTVVVHCPYCHRSHTHAAPGLREDGRRASPCGHGDYRISNTAAQPKGLRRDAHQ